MNFMASYDELRVQLVLINGKARIEVGGRTPDGATPEEIASLFDCLKEGAIAALQVMTPVNAPNRVDH